MRPLHLLLPLALLAPAARGADPDLHGAVREAVAGRRVEDSALKGDATARTPFRGAATNGGVLVGLEVGVGRDGVYAVRPRYRSGEKEWDGPAAGNFLAREVDRRVRLAAKPGYAVGGLVVNANATQLDGLALVCMRVKGPRLDPADQYETEWAGLAPGGTTDRADGAGRPAAGLFGRTADDRVVGLGLTFADVPAAPEATAGDALGTAYQPAPSGGPSILLIAGVAFVGVAVPLGLVGLYVFGRRKADEEDEVIAIVHPTPLPVEAGPAPESASAASDPTPVPAPPPIIEEQSPAAVEILMR